MTFPLSRDPSKGEVPSRADELLEPRLRDNIEEERPTRKRRWHAQEPARPSEPTSNPGVFGSTFNSSIDIETLHQSKAGFNEEGICTIYEVMLLNFTSSGTANKVRLDAVNGTRLVRAYHDSAKGQVSGDSVTWMLHDESVFPVGDSSDGYRLEPEPEVEFLPKPGKTIDVQISWLDPTDTVVSMQELSVPLMDPYAKNDQEDEEMLSYVDHMYGNASHFGLLDRLECSQSEITAEGGDPEATINLGTPSCSSNGKEHVYTLSEVSGEPFTNVTWNVTSGGGKTSHKTLTTAGTPPITTVSLAQGEYQVSYNADQLDVPVTEQLEVVIPEPKIASYSFSCQSPYVLNLGGTVEDIGESKVKSWKWEITDPGKSDPVTAHGQVASVAITDDGSIGATAKLIIEDDAGCIREVSKKVAVSPVKVTLEASRYSWCDADPADGKWFSPEHSVVVNFTGSVSSQCPVEYEWDFGDGTTASTTSPSMSHTFDGVSSGTTRTVTVTATDTHGNTDTDTAQVLLVVEEPPPFSFSVCINGEVKVKGHVPLERSIWKAPGSANPNGLSVIEGSLFKNTDTFKYTVAGKYDVTLIHEYEVAGAPEKGLNLCSNTQQIEIVQIIGCVTTFKRSSNSPTVQVKISKGKRKKKKKRHMRIKGCLKLKRVTIFGKPFINKAKSRTRLKRRSRMRLFGNYLHYNFRSDKVWIESKVAGTIYLDDSHIDEDLECKCADSHKINESATGSNTKKVKAKYSRNKNSPNKKPFVTRPGDLQSTHSWKVDGTSQSGVTHTVV